jgi:AhpD family alkylhydroperoxidase
VKARDAAAAFSTWLPVEEGTDPFALLAAGGPELRTLVDAIFRSGIDPITLELCRLRIATLIGCRSQLDVHAPAAVAAGLDDATIADLAAWPTSPRYTDAQRQAIRFAEQFVLDPRGFTDHDSAGLEAQFTPAQLAALTVAVATFDALARVAAMLAAEPATTSSPTVAARACVPTNEP